MDAGDYLGLMDLARIALFPRTRDDEVEDLQSLLLAHAAGPGRELLAGAVARGCLGENHLWQDLGLPQRQSLSRLLEEHFPRLWEKNSGNMRWKKFFYLQLCEQAEIRACRAPSCGVCAHMQECFGSEEGSPLAPLAQSAASGSHPGGFQKAISRVG